jgi:triphosphoribosyl-dephospho-CoA synthase
MSAALEQAFIRSCTLDIAVVKPGNVSRISAGHGMTASQFIASAAAAAPALCAPGAPIGQRILKAIEAARSVVDCNTNLGIVLLCAPIAAAAEAAFEADGGASAGAATDELRLRRELQRCLHSLTVQDAQAAYRAIALARPGGLGSAPEQDVHEPPTVNLLAAMVLASDRDRVARQYACGFDDLFDIGLTCWRTVTAQASSTMRHLDPRELAMQRTFLEFLARFEDSHIARKHGLARARAVCRQAVGWRRRPI